ncbi:MAG TPA: protein kinase, partial [Myxococcota bacterium]
MDRGLELVLNALVDDGALTATQVQGIVSIAGAGGDAFALARGCGVSEDRWLQTSAALFGLGAADVGLLALEHAPLHRTALGAWSFDLEALHRLQATPYVSGGRLHVAYASGAQAVGKDATSLPPHTATIATVGRISALREAVFGAPVTRPVKPTLAALPAPMPTTAATGPLARAPTPLGWGAPLAVQETAALLATMPAPRADDPYVTPRTPAVPVDVVKLPTPATLPGVSHEEAAATRTSSSSASSSPPAMQTGNWTLERPLGSGAAADVFLAINKSGQRAAYKRLRLDQGGLSDDEQRERFARFEREANLIERLAHINVVRLYDRGVHESGPWLACEYVEGGSVEDLLQETGPMPTTLAMRLVADVLRGLQAAHGLGVVHRDLKPANLLLSTTGVCKVADFGIAKADDDLVRTQQGVTYGSPAYMSPEQAQGQALDARSDLFAVGAIAWQLLVGKSPFERDTVHSTLLAVCTGETGDLLDIAPGVPVVVDTFIRKLLALRQVDRFQTATEALTELQPVIDWIEVHEPGVVARALAAPVETTRQLFRAQARCYQQMADIALRRRPAGRHEAVLALGIASELVDDGSVDNRLAVVESEHQLHWRTPTGPKLKPQNLPEMVRDLPRTETSLTLLRRAGLTHFDAGNVKEARYFLRRAQRFGGADDEVIQTRLRMLQGNSAFAPFELARHATGEVATVAPAPTDTMRVIRTTSSPSSASWESSAAASSSRVTLQAASIAVVAVFALAIGIGYVAGGRNEKKTAVAAASAAVDNGARNEGRHLVGNARRAELDGDVRTAALLYEEAWHRAGDSDVGVDAAVAAARLAIADGDGAVARANLARVLGGKAANDAQRAEARTLLT